MDITLFKRDGSPFYWMKWRVDKKLHRESTKTSNIKIAKKIVTKKQEDLLRNKGIVDVDKLTLTDLINELLQDYRMNDLKSLPITLLKVEIIKTFFGKNRKLVEITTKEILNYVQHRLDKKRKHSTINRELALIRRGFNLLIEHDKIRTAPKITLLNEDNVRQGFFEQYDYFNLMKEAAPHIKPVITFLYRSGWRRSEVLKMTWDMVDIDNGVITLPVGKKFSKTGKGRIYKMPPSVLEMIRGLWSVHVQKVREEKTTTQYVFTNREGTDRIKDFRAAWEGATRRSGLTGRLVHDFRRTAARNYIRGLVPQRVTQELLGHKTSSIFSRYNIVSEQDLMEGPTKQEAYLNSQGNTKPVEVHPEGFREWEPDLVEAKRISKEKEEEFTRYLKEKYEVVIESSEDGVKVLQGELPKQTEVPSPKKTDGKKGKNE